MLPVIIIFLVILSPFILGKILLLRDEVKMQEVKKRIRPDPQQPQPEAPVFDLDDVLDNPEEYAVEPGEAPTMSEKERREAFYRQQAELDSEFLIGYLDDLYKDYNHVQEEMEYLKNRIAICEDAHKYETANKCRKDLEKLAKKRRTLSGQIHGTEKKLRTAQFKSGQKIYT